MYSMFSRMTLADEVVTTSFAATDAGSVDVFDLSSGGASDAGLERSSLNLECSRASEKGNLCRQSAQEGQQSPKQKARDFSGVGASGWMRFYCSAACIKITFAGRAGRTAKYASASAGLTRA